MSKAKDVADYYNSTQIHYEQWWDLSKSQALHYGIWDDSCRSFKDALKNTNRVLMELAKVKDGDAILDAGCGVGGASIFLCSQKDVQVSGITLSQKQLDYASHLIQERGLENNIDIQLMDYTNTSYSDESFDVVWACESVSSAPDKSKFLKEAFRLLKRGGRLVLCDYFLTEIGEESQDDLMRKWEGTWALSPIRPVKQFIEDLTSTGFEGVRVIDYTNQIKKSAKRMYYASLAAALPSELYKIKNPNVTKFARNHYKSGIYQYKALKKKLWNYNVISGVKPI